MLLTTNTFAKGGRVTIAGAPAGHDARVLADLAAEAASTLIVVCVDDVRMAQRAEQLSFFAPDLERIELPAWDCLPYDRVSPNPQVVGRRIEALSWLAAGAAAKPRLLLTTVSAALQKMPAAADLIAQTLTVRRGDRLDLDDLVARLAHLGYGRVETVADRGDYAERPPGVGALAPAAAGRTPG